MLTSTDFILICALLCNARIGSPMKEFSAVGKGATELRKNWREISLNGIELGIQSFVHVSVADSIHASSSVCRHQQHALHFTFYVLP